jgi:cytoskeletal protein RodZ
LQIALVWREESQPNEVWAQRYHTEFPLAMNFLDTSVAARDEQQASEEARRKKEITRTRLTALILGLAFIASLGMGVYAVAQSRDAVRARKIAEDSLKEANEQRVEALAQKKIAEEQSGIAKANLTEANTQKAEAVAQKKNADEQAALAQQEKEAAKQEAIKAETARKVAETAQREAQQQTEIARAAEVKAKKETVKNEKARAANDHFREAVARAQRGGKMLRQHY